MDLPTHTVSLIVILANVGAIIGGTMFGSMSQKIGRRRAMISAALLAVLMVPLWVFSTSVPLIACGAFLMQLGRNDEARIAFDRAIALANTSAEAAHIRMHLDRLMRDSAPPHEARVSK